MPSPEVHQCHNGKLRCAALGGGLCFFLQASTRHHHAASTCRSAASIRVTCYSLDSMQSLPYGLLWATVSSFDSLTGCASACLHDISRPPTRSVGAALLQSAWVGGIVSSRATAPQSRYNLTLAVCAESGQADLAASIIATAMQYGAVELCW